MMKLIKVQVGGERINQIFRLTEEQYKGISEILCSLDGSNKRLMRELTNMKTECTEMKNKKTCPECGELAKKVNLGIEGLIWTCECGYEEPIDEIGTGDVQE